MAHLVAEKSQAGKVVRRLAREYPQADCALVFETPFQLLVATILSAQCTDKRVNVVARALFAEYPAVEKQVVWTGMDVENQDSKLLDEKFSGYAPCI